MGAGLIVAPIFSDHLQRSQVAAALATPGVQSVTLEPTLSRSYRFGCWLVGSLMVTAAILYSRRDETVSSRSEQRFEPSRTEAS